MPVKNLASPRSVARTQIYDCLMANQLSHGKKTEEGLSCLPLLWRWTCVCNACLLWRGRSFPEGSDLIKQSSWGWINYPLEWSFRVNAEGVLLQGSVFLITLRTQCSTAVLWAAKTWNKPIPTMQSIKTKMTEMLREVVHDPPQHFWNSISKLPPKGCILSLKRSSFSADFRGKHLVSFIKIFSRRATQLQALKCSELLPE